MEESRFWHKNYPEGMPTQVHIPNQSLYHFLDQATQKYPDHQAVIFMNQQLTYCELKERVDRFATALHVLGVKKGDRVAIMLPNCPQTVIAYYAVIRLGAIVVMNNPLYVERELLYQLNNSGAETIIFLDQFQPKISNIKSQTSLKVFISTGISDYLAMPAMLPAPETQPVLNPPPGTDILCFEDLLQKNSPKPPEVELDFEKELAVLQYTGGTTGVSKGAMLTHKNLVANVLQTGAWLTICKEARERFFCVLPFYHVFAMTTCMNLSIYLSSAMILIPRLELNNLLKLINDYRPTIFQAVPSLYVAIISHPEVQQYDLSSISCCLSGGAPLPIEVQEKFEAITGGKLVEGYGLTEAAPVTHCNPIEGKKVNGSIGLAFPNTDVKIVEVEKGLEEVPLGETGELCIKGPQVMKGYWHMPEETAAALRDGWLYTGDIARMDEQGFTYIVDRKKDMVITWGYNVYPREVEEVLYQHPKVKEAAVIGIPDATRGEVIKAFIVLKEGQQATKEEIAGFCRKNLANYKVPRKIEFRSELPKSPVGKILRRMLSEETKQP